MLDLCDNFIAFVGNNARLDLTKNTKLKVLRMASNKYGVFWCEDGNAKTFCYVFSLKVLKCCYSMERKYCVPYYFRIIISDEVKFLTVSMATFRDNKKVLNGIFLYVLPTNNPTEDNIAITEEKHHRTVLHSRPKAINHKKACFSLPILTIHIFQRT